MLRPLIAMLLLLAATAPVAPSGASPKVAPRPDMTAELGAFQVVNDNRQAASPRIATFGQLFAPGAVRPGDGLAVSLGGAPAAAQLDAKALYPDGSVRHGVVSVQLPQMSHGQTLKGVIRPGAPPPAHADLAATRPPNLRATLTFKAGPAAGRSVSIDLPALQARGQPWLSGPLVREQRYAAPATSGVQLVFDVRTPAIGPARVDVVVHNDTAQNAAIGTERYDIALTLDDQPVLQVQDLSHYAWAVWHREIYADRMAPPRIVPDTRRLMALGAVPRYAQVSPDPAAVDRLHELAKNGAEPLGFGSVTPYMPMTGGRPDIGPLPTWAVFYLLDPSRENHETLFANADVAGSVPWHARDLRTGGPINIDEHPKVWLDGRSQAVPGVLDRKFYWLDTKWQPDDAHQPSLTYLPYLLSGSRFYRDELAMQAGYVLLAIDPHYRGDSDGIVLGSQIRAVAWDLRTLGQAAYILPAGREQAYFQAKLEGNLKEILRRYVHGHELDAAGELEGYVPGPYAVETAVPPWQEDYLAMVLGSLDSMGFTDARPVLSWMTNFVAGRFLNGQRGYPPIYGTPYFLFVADPSSRAPLNTWAEAFIETFPPAHKPVTALDSPDSGGGYAALARGALASIVNTTGSADAKAAYAFVKAHTPGMPTAYASDPTFAIAPVEAAS
jgi:hypothetical protein